MPIQLNLRRHGKRQRGKVTPDVPLTRGGKISALSRGIGLRLLGRKPKLYSSEFVRTRQTGELIARGAGSKYKTRTRKNWGFELVRSKELREASKPFRESGEEVFVDNWLKGKLPKEIFHTPHEAALRLVSEMHLLPRAGKRLAFSKTPSKTIQLEAIGHVPHLMALLHELTGKRMEIEDQLKFLETATLTFDFNRVRLRYRKESFDVTDRFRALLAESQRR